MNSKRKRWILCGIAVLAFTFVLLHTPRTQDFIRRALEGWMTSELGGTAAIEVLDYRLWRGEIVLQGLSLEPEAPWSLGVPIATLRWTPWSGATLRVERPILTNFQNAEPSETNVGRAALPTLPAFLSRLEVRSGTVQVGLRNIEPWLELDSIEVDLDHRTNSYAGRFQSAAGRAGGVVFGPMKADFRGGPDRFDLEEGKVEKNSSQLRATGSITSLSPLVAQAVVDFTADAAIANELRPDLDLSGTITGHADLNRSSTDLSGSIELSSPSLTSPLGTWALETGATLLSGALEVHRIHLEGYGGSIDAEGRTDLATDESSLEVRFAGLELGSLLDRSTERSIPLTSRIDGRLQVGLSAWDREHTEMAGRISFQKSPAGDGIPVRGAVGVSSQNGTLHLVTDGLHVLDDPLNLEGELGPDGAWSATYTAEIAKIHRLDPLLEFLELPIPPPDLLGGLSVHGEASGSINESASPTTNLILSGHGLVFRGEPFRAEANLRVTGEELHINELEIGDKEGQIAIQGTVRNETLTVTGLVNDFEIDGLASSYAMPIGGRAGGRFSITGPIRNPNFLVNVQVSPLSFRELTGEATMTLRKEGQGLHLDRFEIRTGDSTGWVSGYVDLDSQEVDLKLNAAGWRLSQVLPSATGLDAIVSSEGEIQGKLRAPVGSLRLRLDDITHQGNDMPAVFVEAHSDGRNVTGDARLADGSALASSECRLETPYLCRATLLLESLPLGKILRDTFPSAPEDTELVAQGELEVSASLLHPLDFQYELRVDQLAGLYQGIAGGTGSTFTIRGDRRFFTIDELDFVGTDTALAVSGRVPLVPDENFDLDIKGQARLELLEAWFEENEIQGEASLDLRIEGPRSRPQAAGDLRIDQGAITWRGVRATTFSAFIEVDKDTLRLREMSGKLLGGTVQLSAEWPFLKPLPGRPGRLDITMSEIDLGQLLELPDSGVRPLFRVSTSGSIQVPELDPSTFVGSGELHQLRTSLGDLMLQNDSPTAWNLKEGKLTLAALHIVGGETDLLVDAVAALSSENADWQTHLRGTLDNRFVEPLLLRSWDVALRGTTEVDLQLKSTPEGPSLDGIGSWDEARIVIREPPFVLTNIKGEARFEGQTITLRNLEAETGGGSVRGSGSFEHSDLRELTAVDLELETDSISLSYPEGMQSRVAGTLRLNGSPERYLLSGEIRLLEGLYQREITLESELLGAIDRQGVRIASPETGSVHLDVVARTVEEVKIENTLAQLATGANLRVTGTLSEPEIDGVLTALPEGTFQLGRNRYTIDSGTVVLRGYPLQPAELDISASTSVSGTDVQVRIQGPMDNIDLRLEAPGRDDLTRADIASLLVTGRTMTTTDGFENVSGQQGRILGEQLAFYLSGALTQVLRQGLGQSFPLDVVTVGPDQLSTDVNPETRFTIGRAVTQELFVTYSVGLQNAQNQLWIFDYKLPKQLALRATRKEDNELTGGLSQKLHLDFPGRPERPTVRRTRKKIATLRLEGSPEDLKSQLAQQVRLRSGKDYDFWKSRKDVERLIRSLHEANYLNAVVDVETSSGSGAEIDVTYRINPGLPLRIRWEGEDPGSKIRQRIERRWDGRFPEDFQLRDLASRTERLLQVDRYYTAEVTTSTGPSSDGTREVTFDVFKGDRGRRVSMLFEGNQALTDRQLDRAVPSASSPELFDLIYGDAQRLRDNLRLVYAAHGHLQSRIGVPIIGYRADLGELQVTVPIEEGPRTNVARIELTGAQGLDRNHLVRELRTQEGAPFKIDDAIADRSTIASTYRRAGFPESETSLRVEFREEELHVLFEIDEGRPVTIGRVHVRGNHGVSERLIRSQFTFREGDPLKLTELTETQRRLYELGVFRSADVRAEPSTENPLKRDVVVQVNETADFDLGYGLRYSTEDRFEALGTLRFPHVFGSASTLGLSVVANASRKTARGTFSNPYFFKYRLPTDLFLGWESEDEESFRDRNWTFTFQQTKALAERLDLQWSYTFKHTHFVGFLGDSPFPFDFTTLQSILTTSIIEDKRDKIVEPTAGRFLAMTFQFAPEALGSDIKFVKLFGQLNTFFTLRRNLVWAASYRLGIADAFDQILLEDERFRAGGATTVRGFEQDSLGPMSPVTDTTIGGEGLVVFNQELRFPLYRFLRGIVFYDAGNVFLNASDFRLFDLRQSAGAGLRVSLPFGLLRFDWAWVLDRQPGEKGYQFWFNLNHAF